jgi:hypothetical protein
MSIELTWPWAALLLLGAAHGINPGMGWLFAVALGLQRRDRRAVWRALLPLALGHALAIAAVVALAAVIGLVLPLRYLKWLVAVALLGFGLFHLTRHRHPRWGGMRVGARDLAIWSFLMASAHGAGLMALPFVVEAAPQMHTSALELGAHVAHATAGQVAGGVHPASVAGHAGHVSMLLTELPADRVVGMMATVVHTLGYLLITGLVAVVVYEKVGLRMLRSMWLNLNLIWAAALVVTALLTPLI